jgi:hypothetical protein
VIFLHLLAVVIVPLWFSSMQNLINRDGGRWIGREDGGHELSQEAPE